MIGVNIDVTERKLADEARLEVNRTLEAQAALLQSREELLKIFVKHVPAAVAMLDRDMRYLQVSDRWCADYSSTVRKYWGVRTTKLFLTFPNGGRDSPPRSSGETLRAEEDRWDRESGTNWSRWEIRPWQNLKTGCREGFLSFRRTLPTASKLKSHS